MIIPKIIHQLWIGTKPAPITLMNTWKDKNPDFEYIFWNEKEIEKRNFKFVCQDKIDDIEEINGKADIMRWEILYEYGGIFCDADSICIEPIDDELLNKECFSCWEHEELRYGLISLGTIGFPPKHPMIEEAIKRTMENEVSFKKTGKHAWVNVGPVLITRIWETGRFPDLHIFPSYTFLPEHYTGTKYEGHGKIYAYQAWGSTHNSYDTMNEFILPICYQKPSIENTVSVLVEKNNNENDTHMIENFLESIRHQIGYINIELVFINNTDIDVKKILENFEKTTRFITVKYDTPSFKTIKCDYHDCLSKNQLLEYFEKN